MLTAFNRPCGRKNKPRQSLNQVGYDRENSLVGIEQITSGYKEWAEEYIKQCQGQRKFKYQIKRMNKWFKRLSEHLQVELGLFYILKSILTKFQIQPFYYKSYSD